MTTSDTPSFARVEIALTKKDDLIIAAAELRLLATELDVISGGTLDDELALLLAHHKIKHTSKKLRAPE